MSDVAIVGLSCRLPGARDLGEFWRNLAGGVESIARLPGHEVLPGYVNAAPVLDDPGGFDAGFFGYSPLEAKTMDPQQRLLLELAHEALEHAGHDPERYPGRIGVFAASALNTYFIAAGLHGRLAQDYIATLIANDKDFLATRISYKLNLKGPSLTVQTACSSSLVAIHLARQSLLGEETDMALAGAVSVRAPHRAGYFCDGGGVLSPDGRVRAFDAAANGTVFGSGGGVVVLKRLADALADRDTIHAVIKGSAINNDGSAKAGYTAPSVDSQADAVVEAIANAGVDADSIGYVEAHGSGTPVGDPIEVRALTKAFRAFTQRSGYCALGSVKTNLGHLDAAAGMAGVIKTVLALEHRQLPPSLHFTTPNPEIDFPQTPFYVNTELKPWIGHPLRRAGVMSTGMGGTNAHLVLEEAPPPSAASRSMAPQLLVVSAKTATALEQAKQQLQEFLQEDSSALDDIAHTLRVGRRAFEHRACMVCSSRNDAAAAKVHSAVARARRPVVLLLPGVGDQYAGMGQGLYETCEVFRHEVDRCAAILQPLLGLDIRQVLERPEQSARPGIDLKKMLHRTSNLHGTLVAQPALFTIEYAMARLWQSLGVAPDAIVGHSMGEYVAACLAGVLSLEDALRLLVARAKLVSTLPEAAMLAVTLPEDQLSALLPAELSICLVNGPNLCAVAGPPAAVAEFEAKSGVICRRVQNAHAFHSRLLEPIAEAFEREVRKVRLQEPARRYISNITGTWIGPGEATNPRYWVLHATRTARFGDALRELWQLPDPVLLEAGPGRTLGVLATQHPARPRGSLAIASLRHDYENQPDLEVLLQAAGKLWCAGVDLRWDALPGAAAQRRIPLPTYPFERQSYWLEAQAPLPAGTLAKNPDAAEWLYAPSWKRVLPPAIGADTRGQQPGAWLVFADEAGFARALIRKLRSAGHDVVTVRAGARFQRHDAHSFTVVPANAQHYDLLLRALNGALPERIVHAWSVTGRLGPRESGTRFARAQALGFYSLVYLARALGAAVGGREVRLCAVSNHVQDVCGTEALCPEKATLLGPCLVIRQEYPNIRVKSVDLDASPQAGGQEAAADLVVAECQQWDANVFVAGRNGQRWSQSHERVPARQDAGPQFRQRGVYLITGGLGRVGAAIAQYLAQNYKARLVLVGRSRVPERQSCARIEQLGGEVLYVDANVADEVAMRAALARAQQRFGALHGVIHAAGMARPASHREIKDSDYSSCEEHFQAKAHGVRVLEQVLEGRALDFCLLVSSLVSVLGGIGHVAYAAASNYLDAFARAHNRAARLRWLNVNWDFWRLEDHAAGAPGPGTTLGELGMKAEEATRVLESVLALRGAGQLMVSTGELGARLDQWVKLESLEKPRAAPAPRARRRAELAAPRDETERRICRIWQDALGVDEVGIDQSFFELGGHSLLAIRVIVELRKAFGIDLPVKALFDATTVAGLARRVDGLALLEKARLPGVAALDREEIEL